MAFLSAGRFEYTSMFADPSGEEPSMQFSVRAGVGVSGKTECAIIQLFGLARPKSAFAEHRWF
jgi:hypothetical protein